VAVEQPLMAKGENPRIAVQFTKMATFNITLDCNSHRTGWHDMYRWQSDAIRSSRAGRDLPAAIWVN
jgi:hypothetical protein